MPEKKFDPFMDDIGMEEEDLTSEVKSEAGDMDSVFVDPVFSPAKKAEPATAPKAEVKTEAKAKKDDDFLSGLGDMPSGVVVGEIGKVNTSMYPIQRAKFSKDAKTLMSVVSPKAAVVFNTHFIEQSKFNIVCFDGKCCTDLGSPRKRIVLPVVIYTTDHKGKPITTDVTFAALSLSKDYYESILTFNALKAPGDISDMDILVQCSDEKYQKLTFFDDGPARWKKSPETIKKVKDFWRENFKYLVPVVARPVTEKEYGKIMGVIETPLPSVPEATDASKLDIFG